MPVWRALHVEWYVRAPLPAALPRDEGVCLPTGEEFDKGFDAVQCSSCSTFARFVDEDAEP
jgi:hypothetical protein